MRQRTFTVSHRQVMPNGGLINYVLVGAHGEEPGWAVHGHLHRKNVWVLGCHVNGLALVDLEARGV